mmetsp:Transcript_2100/g.4681  ORF Transcript_2100/g.4681 Transcript_2100/m.4681 type:complete len:214 (-) Transcript_2100:491-1132(-)
MWLRISINCFLRRSNATESHALGRKNPSRSRNTAPCTPSRGKRNTKSGSKSSRASIMQKRVSASVLRSCSISCVVRVDESLAKRSSFHIENLSARELRLCEFASCLEDFGLALSSGINMVSIFLRRVDRSAYDEQDFVQLFFNSAYLQTHRRRVQHSMCHVFFKPYEFLLNSIQRIHSTCHVHLNLLLLTRFRTPHQHAFLHFLVFDGVVVGA